MEAIFDQICSSTQFLGQESGGMTVKPCGIPVDRTVPFDKDPQYYVTLDKKGMGHVSNVACLCKRKLFSSKSVQILSWSKVMLCDSKTGRDACKTVCFFC